VPVTTSSSPSSPPRPHGIQETAVPDNMGVTTTQRKGVLGPRTSNAPSTSPGETPLDYETCAVDDATFVLRFNQKLPRTPRATARLEHPIRRKLHWVINRLTEVFRFAKMIGTIAILWAEVYLTPIMRPPLCPCNAEALGTFLLLLRRRQLLNSYTSSNVASPLHRSKLPRQLHADLCNILLSDCMRLALFL
jgi:hypothetical protein